jgi:asparagine synthase (glutamine-hydrolysing)
MNQSNKNRGPDDSGIYLNEKVSLGQNRLSIIDLSDNGHQPMSNADGTLWIIYNGEIYNFNGIKEQLINQGHKFVSKTDTEVVLHAYEQFGFDCLKIFNGMWAFCIYDSKKELLFLARDQYGIKPLYYKKDSENIIFSSTISAILDHDIESKPNPKEIMNYLSYNIEDWNEDTFFIDIKRILPGNYAVFDLAKRDLVISKWNNRPNTSSTEKPNDRDLRSKFIESVKLRTISDVSIGACLSGGIDSSAIVSILDQQLEDSFSTYSLVAPGFSRDESKYIDIINSRCHTTPHKTELELNIFFKDIADFVYYQEEPVPGMSCFAQYQVMKLAYENRAKVLLDGQGGDEILGGYSYYFSYYFIELLYNFKLYKLLKEVGSNLILNKQKSQMYPLLLWAFLMIPDKLKFGVWSKFNENWINKDYLVETCGRNGDPRWYQKNLRDIQSMSLYQTSIPELLRYEDKNAMRFSIESRPPFLDPNFIEYCNNLSMSQMISGGITKSIFRDAMDGIVPNEILARRDKIGFEAPVDNLFRDPRMILLCNSIFNSENFRSRPYWIPEKVEQLLNNHISRRVSAGDKLWKILTTELWLQIFFDKEGIENGRRKVSEFISSFLNSKTSSSSP